jgi:hypothetical protein
VKELKTLIAAILTLAVVLSTQFAMAEKRTDQVILPSNQAAITRPVGDGTTTDFGADVLVDRSKEIQGTGSDGS